MKQYQDRPFTLLGVHVDGIPAQQVQQVMVDNDLPWRSFVDVGDAGAGGIVSRWNRPATPTFYLIDHEGVIRYRWAGPPGDQIMDAALDELIRATER